MQKKNNLSGIVYMLLGMFFFSAMDAAAKWLVQGQLDPIQIIAIRSWFIVTGLICFYAIRNNSHELIPSRPIPQGVRGVLGLIAPYCFFMSLKTLPLADTTVIFFSGAFMITAMSWPLLKEQVGVHRWIAVIIGFSGVIMAMNPKGEGQLSGYLYCLVSSFSYALLFISGRWLSKTESVISMVFCFNLGLAFVSTLLAPFIWESMSIMQIFAVMLFSLLGFCGHFCLTTAFSIAKVGIITPFEYTALLWGVLFGYLFWHDIPASNVIYGALTIICCGLYVIYRESRKSRLTVKADLN